MTHIDFHTNIADKFLYTCRLVRKARSSQCQIVILTNTADDLAKLDKALWTFSEHDFLPHVTADDPLAPQTPIILTSDDSVTLPHHQVLINLSGSTPACFALFERMVEIVSLDETDKNNSRQRYRFYQQAGHTLTHSVATNT
ncbi:DNA polymerase III subunit chi [Glaciimonas sp. GG7]